MSAVRRPRLLALLVLPLASLLFSCSTALEVYMASEEPPSVEMALDRINTAARSLEIQDIMLRGMPISAASTWPGDLDRPVPKGDDARLGQILLEEELIGRPRFHSPVRLKVLVMQTALFDSFPSMYYDRKYLDKIPSAEAIEEFGRRTLGDGYNPVFNKSFYRFMRFTPDFKPKKAHFEGKLEGRSAEFYPSLEDAVISLAENQGQLEKIREEMAEVDEQKKRSERDVSESGRMIRTLKDGGKGAGNPDLEAARGELAVHKKEFDAAAGRYAELLKAWKSELSKIRGQATAFNDEQKALARNIQSAVSASKGLYVDSAALVAIALFKLPDSLNHLGDELKHIARSPHADVRIARIFKSLESLFENAGIIRTGLEQLHAEADAMDGLFDKRIKTTTGK